MNTNIIRLSLGLILGLFLSLLYGWLIRPVEYVDTSPATLREDFRTDYVLMVAESYRGEQHLELAHIRLAALGPELPFSYVADAIDYAGQLGFSSLDIQLLAELAEALNSGS
jgi:hypothetical protein